MTVLFSHQGTDLTAPGTHHRVTMPDLVRLARKLYEGSFALTSDEESAYVLCDFTMAPVLAIRDPERKDPSWVDNADLTSGRWAARWYSCGLPRVRLRAARAASFAATAIPHEVVARVLPPWPAFMIEVDDADDLLAHPALPAIGLDRLEVLHASGPSGSPAWSFFARGREDAALCKLWVEPEQWASDLCSDRLFDGVPEHADARLFQVVGRIILGCCLALSTPEAHEEARHRGRSKRFRTRGIPVITDFVVTNDVRVDVRRAVRDYITRGGTPPTVQSLVRGHWKWQAHGVGCAFRKWIHVEPYWRGPEDAPVALRGHVLHP